MPAPTWRFENTTRPHTASAAAPTGVLNVMYWTAGPFPAFGFSAEIQFSPFAPTASTLWRASKMGSLPPASAFWFVSHSFIATAFGKLAEMSALTAVVAGLPTAGGGFSGSAHVAIELTRGSGDLRSQT